ncbi:DUF169 domain-containing protein [Pelosinus propionicus]|uniref:Uncharacterized conserved protein, DUF169 family n=1 Tax=Pelosinus propionicus DSM 13327 TaxID=1123291 RepID=A0A1I4M958_9FIRM|nr:DUF169 domain-containing protein [Pelosinus propionicus]SFL99812.1 Uncharacterized conserved protein, DUF169 family [Pelosinus propionicus DSM 13327]
MQSEIAQRLKLRYSPIAILFTNEKPQGSLEFKEGKWGCVAAMLTAAAKGRRAVFSRNTFGCEGGGIGLGLLNEYSEGMEYFLSTGKAGLTPVEGIREPEGFKKTPELAKAWMESVPSIDVAEQYIVFKPLAEVEDQEEPKVVVFYANPDQLTALVVLANYGRPGHDNVIAPFGAGCQTACLFPGSEADEERPRAVIGMTDISVRPRIDADLLSFSMPYAMFKEMEDNVPGSFLDRHEWKQIAERIPG